MSRPAVLDPYVLFAALHRKRAAYVAVRGFARVVYTSAELTDWLDIVPSLQPENLRILPRPRGARRPRA
jgi:hypothetical protein